MNIPLADYIDERRAFDALLNADCKQRILLFQGESGSGKSSLLEDCLTRAGQAGEVHCIIIDCKGGAFPIEEIFSLSADTLGGRSLASFARQLAALQGLPEINIESNRQTGYNNQINVTLQVNDPSLREQRIVALTEALFEDIKASAQPVLFVIDTYEEAKIEVQKWLSGPFLARVARVSQVRTLIAGQQVPERNITWGRHCSLHELRGVLEPTHWLPVVQAMRRRIPGESPVECLRGICLAMNGNPGGIMTIIQGFTPEETQP